MSAGFAVSISNIQPLPEFARCVQFALPHFPIPLSGCFKNVAKNGRADTDRYASWKRETDWALKKKRNLCGRPGAPTIAGTVSVTFALRRPDKRQRDLDNLLKALGDTLTRNHIIEDDSKIVDLRIRWTGEAFDGAVMVCAGAGSAIEIGCEVLACVTGGESIAVAIARTRTERT